MSDTYEAHDRLWNPVNAVLDDGIDLRRGKGVGVKGDARRSLKVRQPDDRLPEVEAKPIAVANSAQGITINITVNINFGQEWSEPVREHPFVGDVLKIAAKHFKVSVIDLLSTKRPEPLVRARHIAVYLATKLCVASLPEIGRRIGGRDHTTILHARNKIAEMIKHDASIRDDVEAIAQAIGEALGVEIPQALCPSSSLRKIEGEG